MEGEPYRRFAFQTFLNSFSNLDERDGYGAGEEENIV